MSKIRLCIFVLISCQFSIEAIVDMTLESGYLSGKTVTTVTSGSDTSVNFSGYMLKSAVHLNTSMASLTFGVGPTLTLPYIAYGSLPSTWIKSEISALRYGGEVYARYEILDIFQPFVRFELGKDNITETNSAYPVITSGPGAGTVVTSQIAELKYSYGGLYYSIGAGIQAKLMSILSTFILVGFTTGKASSVTVDSFALNGVAVTNYTSNFGSISYTALQVSGGLMFSF